MQHDPSMVPANASSDARLRGAEDDAARSKRDEPSEPDTPRARTSDARRDGSPTGAAPPAEPKGGGRGTVSKAECDRVMNRYLELEIAHNPQLKGLPPEAIEQAKQMAREQHGDAPCSATRAQYTCGMAATSTAAWERCLK